jgi:hypothetical protein
VHELFSILFTSLITIVSVFLFSGCSNKSASESQLESYLANVRQACGNRDNQHAYTPALTPYPGQRQTRLKVQDIRIGFMDFFSLSACHLQALIAERNSALGKIMPVSQQMIYEHRFLIKALECQLQGEKASHKDLYKKLEKVIAIKRDNLPKIYWNATFSSPEFEKMFACASSALDDKDLSTLDYTINALIYLLDVGEKLGNSEFTIDGKELEDKYFHLSRRKAGGEILYSLDLLTYYLNQVSTTLDIRVSKTPLCPEGRPNKEAQKLFEIFRLQYIFEIQPYIVKLNQKAEQFLTLINRMAEPQKTLMPEPFVIFYEKQINMHASEGMWQRFRKALSRHTQSWQKVLSQCGLTPL